jgi:uncharacterized membrane protein
MVRIRLFVPVLAVIVSATLLGASLYDQVVLAPNLMGAPASLEHARGFMHAASPATLFRRLSPLNQAVLALGLILLWKPDRTARWLMMAALVCGVAGDVVTFQFHYPRNAILFGEPLTRPAAEFDRVAEEWAMGNYFRIALVVAAVTCSSIALVRTAKRH